LNIQFFSTPIFVLLFGCCLISCSSYKQNIMFKVPDDGTMTNKISEAEKNYTLQPNDAFTMEVFTNDGERLIDPEFELTKENAASLEEKAPENYIVDENGIVKLPMVGVIKITTLTLRQGEELLQKEYSKYYKNPFVKMSFTSKRVIVLGSPGGQIIPLTNNSTNLVEVLAMAKGITNDGKAHNIRVIRGNEVMVANLSTFEGYTKYNVVMQSGDIVYVEPVRKPFVESLRDYAPILTALTSLTTLIVVIQGI
jgi:polysaccharide biosynthesis/export protein